MEHTAGRRIEQKKVQKVVVKKPQIGATYSKFIKSNLYSPLPSYPVLHQEVFSGLAPEPLMVSLLPPGGQLSQLRYCASRFSNVPKGSILSYQQKYSQKYVINDSICPDFPQLPLESSIENIENNLAICLERAKLSALTSLQINRETAIEIEKGMTTQAATSMWHAIRSNRKTVSKVGIVAKRLSKFDALTNQLSKGRHIQTAAIKRGITMEAPAAMIYAQNAKTCTVNLLPSGLMCVSASGYITMCIRIWLYTL